MCAYKRKQTNSGNLSNNNKQGREGGREGRIGRRTQMGASVQGVYHFPDSEAKVLFPYFPFLFEGGRAGKVRGRKEINIYLSPLQNTHKKDSDINRRKGNET